MGEPSGMRVLLPALALLLLIAGCGGDPEAPPVTPSLAPTPAPLSFTPVRDRYGSLIDRAAAAWIICYRDHGSQGRQGECGDEYAIAATVATSVSSTIDLQLVDQGLYRKVRAEAAETRAAFDRYEAAGCLPGFAVGAEPCTGHITAMAVAWSSMLIALETIEPTG